MRISTDFSSCKLSFCFDKQPVSQIPSVVELDTSECNSGKPWNGMTCFNFQLNHTSLCRASSLSFNSFSCFWKDFSHSSICTWPCPFRLWEPWLDNLLGLRKQTTCSVKHAFKSYWEQFHNTNDAFFCLSCQRFQGQGLSLLLKSGHWTYFANANNKESVTLTVWRRWNLVSKLLQ